jgi:sec-independent protein translocase protein TatC
MGNLDRHVRNPQAVLPLAGHLRELKIRLFVSMIALIVGSVACFVFYNRIFELFYEPFANIEKTFGATLFITTIFEGFVTKLKLSIVAGLVVSFPVHMFNLVRFIFPGLTKKEKKVVGFSLLASFFLIVFAFYYCYFYLIPMTVQFLTGAGFVPKNVGMLLNYGKNIFYILQFLLLILAIFQAPVLMEILMILNILKRRTLLKISRYVVFIVTVVAAAVTPDPTFISQLGVAVPLTALYFLALLIARIFHFGEG